MNIVLGFVIFIIWSISAVGPSTITVARALEDSPASTVLRKNDQLVAVSGKKVTSSENFSERVAESRNKTIQLTARRGNKTRTVSLEPKLVRYNGEKIY